MGALLRRLLLPLACCLLVSFSFPCSLDIDGHGNTGDETMTVALASDVSLHALTPYGYHPDGRAWTWGVNTAPLYSWFYGAAVKMASPLRRIEAARLVSRAIGAVALYLIAIALLQLVWQTTLSRVPVGVQAGIFAFVILALLNSPRFRFIMSSARVDALGFLFLAIVVAAASRLILAPRRLGVFLFTFLALSTAWTSYIAFYLVAFVAAVTLLAAAIVTASEQPLLPRVKSMLLNVALPSAGALLLFAAASALLRGALFSGPASDAANSMASRLSWVATARGQLQALERPDREWFLEAGIYGFIAVCLKELVQAVVPESRNGQPREPMPALLRDLGWLGIAVGVLNLTYRMWLVTLGSLPIRFTYDVMITTAAAFLQIIAFCFILRKRSIDRYIMSGAVAVALAAGSLYPWSPPGEAWYLCREESAQIRDRFWPVSPALVGVFNPFDDSGDEANRARRSHGEAARDFLRQHSVSKAMATDPMFASWSDRDLEFYFLNDMGSPAPSPAAEQMLVKEFVSRMGVRYLVSTEYGQSARLERAGVAGLRACLRQMSGASTVCTFGGQRVELKRVFRTDQAVTAPAAYHYDVESSTPISIYLVTSGESQK